MRRTSVFVILGALGLISCGGSQPAAPTSQSSNLALRGAVTLGEVVPSVQLTLTDGGADVTNSGTWQSSNTAVATVSSGLVRAAGPGATTISAAYKSQTVSSSITVAPDQDCVPYDPSTVSTRPNPQDSTAVAVTASTSAGTAIFSLAGTPTDVTNLVALYRRYGQACYIGRNYGPQYIVTYFKGVSGQQTTIAPEDCVAYSAASLQVVSQGATGWALVSGGTQIALLASAFEAALASNVAAQASNECYIGRGNTRPNPYAFITEYWK
jgi:hypothetical protein